MADNLYVLKAILVMAAATFLTRVFPFLLPAKARRNDHLRFIGTTLPASVMLLLVIYCLKDVRYAAPPYGVPELLAVAVVVVLHLWRRNGLLSIGMGTACYLFLTRSGTIERLLAW